MKSLFDEKTEVVGWAVVLFMFASVGLGWAVSWPQATAIVFGVYAILKIRIERFGPSGVEVSDGS